MSTAAPPESRIGDLCRPLAEVDVPGKCGWVRRKLREVVQNLLVLQLRQGASLVDRSMAKPTGRASR